MAGRQRRQGAQYAKGVLAAAAGRAPLVALAETYLAAGQNLSAVLIR